MSDEDIAKEYGATLITKACCLDLIPVTKYQTKTGIHLIIANVDGPLVSTYLCLATEAHDDDGLPHTLEHLIFLGSEEYPYKGLLDLLANKCLASGTNAWTDVDHTAYTLQTAGAEGTLALLPVYLDHVLYPVLTEYGFITEVHHISGEGNDAGVVYCEMQGRENSGESRTDRATLSALYKDTGYDAETGGIMLNLRTSTTNEKVKAYHAEFYRPENLTIIIAGAVKADDVFKAIRPVEEKIISKNKLPPYIRPWQQTVPQLTKKQVLNIKYPTDSEDCGMVEISWLGPNITTSEGRKDISSVSILLRYLSDTPIAPLQKLLVEIKDPYASDVSYGITENSTAKFSFSFENVPIEKLQEVIPIVTKEIEDIVSKKNSLELTRIQRIVRKQLRECLMNVENSPHESVAYKCIADMLYSKTNDQLEWRLNSHEFLRELLDKDEEFWRSLLEKYFGDNYVAVISSPSIDLMAQMFEEDKQRIENQIEELGKDGLQKKAEKLAEAMAYNSREVPTEILRSIEVANCMNIQYHTLQSWTSTGEKCPYFDLKKMPFYTQINNLKTNFVYMNLIMNTTCLNKQQRKYLPLLLEVIYQCPVKRGDEIIPYDVVLSEIEDNFNDLNISLGSGSGYGSSSFSPGSFQNLIFASAQCETDKYETVVKLITEVLLYSIFNKDRLLVVTQKLINEVATYRRQGNTICNDLIRDMKYSDDSNVHLCSVLRQYKFLNEILKKLEDDNSANEILSELEEIRKAITAPGNTWLHMAANLEKHSLSAEPWAKFGANGTQEGFTIDDYKSMLPLNKRENVGCVLGVGGVDSCFLHQNSPGPLYSNHPDLPALAVALTYFTQLEGPMWRIVRGGGFAYSYSIVPIPEEGLLRLKLFKATNAPAAYKETVNILKGFLDNPKWDEDLFASAKSALIYEFVQNEKTPSSIVALSLTSYLKHVSFEYNRKFIQAINNVNMEDATRVAQTWLPGLFDPSISVVSIVSHPSKIVEINKEFDKMGFKLDAVKTLEESVLNLP